MINLDYSLRSSESIDLKRATKEQLHYDLFNGDIIFRVEGADFSTDWGWVPILDFSVIFARSVLDLPNDLQAVFEFTESESKIFLELRNDKVIVSSSYTQDFGVVVYVELLQASLSYVAKVLFDLSCFYSSLKENKIFQKYCKEFNVRL